jgi:uncharacterized protein (TIGR02147 family)
MPNVFEYTDYREYLRDSYALNKKQDPRFSYRNFSMRLGFSSPNFLMLVVQGKRNISRSTCFKISKLLRHTKREAGYFENMVFFSQVESQEEKSACFGAMMELRRNLKVARIDEAQYQYLSTWYNPVVRELACMAGTSADSKALAARLSPRITASQARRALDLLKTLGLIRESKGRHVQADPILSTGPEVNSVAAADFHKAMAQLAAESYDRHTRAERTITGCTVAITKEQFQELKRELADMRKRALEKAQAASGPVRVYQLNLHLFPVSRRWEGGDS